MTDLNVYGPFLSKQMARERGLVRYYDGRVCPHGHIEARKVSNGSCCECMKRIRKEQKRKNPDKVAAQKARNWRRVIADPKRHEPTKARYLRSWKRRYYAGPELLEAQKERYRTDPQTNMKVRLRARIRSAVREMQVDKSGRTFDLVGCSILDLMRHLESQFKDGMSWENMSEWHIDHIRPCASFDLTDEAQQRECFHYTNLQPLWATENLQKHAKWAA
mgnify:CR=1 FL=1